MIKLFNPLFFLVGSIISFFNFQGKVDIFRIKYPSFMSKLELGRSILGTYEKNERKLVKKFVCNQDSVLELGACIGVVSLTINKILSDKTKHISVEPNPQMYEYLELNKKNNNAKFQIETCIVSNSKEIEFYLGGSAFLSSSIHGSGNKVIIQGKTFKELTEQYFDFTAIVMDIEGGELDFFQSFDLSETKVRLIIWETHESVSKLTHNELLKCYELLKSYGFKFTERSDNVEAWIR